MTRRLWHGPDRYSRSELRDKIEQLRTWGADEDSGDLTWAITQREWCAQARVILDEVRELCDRLDEAEQLLEES